jgi:hypothetical protein
VGKRQDTLRSCPARERPGIRPCEIDEFHPHGRRDLERCGLLGCAAFNKLLLTPRLLADHGAAVEGLRRSIGFEFAFVAAILLTTAIVTSLFGPA